MPHEREPALTLAGRQRADENPQWCGTSKILWIEFDRETSPMLREGFRGHLFELLRRSREEIVPAALRFELREKPLRGRILLIFRQILQHRDGLFQLCRHETEILPPAEPFSGERPGFPPSRAARPGSDLQYKLRWLIEFFP